MNLSIIFSKEQISLGLNIRNIWDNVRTQLYKKYKTGVVILRCFNVEMLHVISIIFLSKMH